jgi:alkanesulfonate monooxygenase SsuD/methylene tetrahydromethanopterin reductase-like flavin-dependent oxidoreductase (luciferase family)
MEIGVHLPQLDFDGEGLSLSRVIRTVETARELGFAAVSANDHFVYQRPWLDGPTALACAIEHSGEMSLVTSIALAGLRGPVPLAKTLAALDLLSGGRVVAGLGPGSSAADYAAMGVSFEERWPRFDEAITLLRAALRGGPPQVQPRFFAMPEGELLPRAPSGVPLWIGSWGSAAGLRRVVRLGDGWMASAYNTDPDTFAAGLATLGPDFPNALVTMWMWITEDRAEVERVIAQTLAPFLNREPDALRGRLCVGTADECAELLARYQRAGCARVHVWPLGDEVHQLERLAREVLPHVN